VPGKFSPEPDVGQPESLIWGTNPQISFVDEGFCIVPTSASPNYRLMAITIRPKHESGTIPFIHGQKGPPFLLKPASYKEYPPRDSNSLVLQHKLSYEDPTTGYSMEFTHEINAMWSLKFNVR
jgi:hypothetical protein